MDEISRHTEDKEMFRPAMANRSLQSCTVIPVLIYDDVADAIEWLCRTFGFTERLRAGKHHAQLTIGDGAIMLSDSRSGQEFDSPDDAEFLSPRSKEVKHEILVNVKDVNKHYKNAHSRGARILRKPKDCMFGERQYTVEDLGGHRWTFSQTIADVDPKEWGAIKARTE
ncbi:VOC family protein [Bacillus sp. FJAT-49732]|uniref:VOC family protein n=1 Tax=Lederbergia citrisecunda TaxID=2833583 RepID=A0A942TPP9_9BACI|nr:VOC family protein [Lederbergia citrisecunda]MBS4202200.1 VOC family protein [Lederbergia citrisecunda]